MVEKALERPASILVVDDEQGVLDMFTALLGVSGYQVRTESSGEEAQSFLQEIAAEMADPDVPELIPVDLVILDVLMPGMGGHELCRWIKGHIWLRYVPVLMVTALGSMEDQIEGIDVGADDYIAKPFRSEELLVRVRALLRISQIQGELLDRNRELRALRRFNENILQNMGEGLFTVDDQAKITSMNPVAANLLGGAAGEYEGRSVGDLSQSYRALVEIIADSLRRQEPCSYKEIAIAYDQGEELPLRVNTSLLHEDDERSGLVCLIEDLSEIKAMEAEQRRLDRLAVLGQMAASVAHEIRNPLVTLSLGIGYLERKLAGQGQEYETTLQRLRHQVDRLSQIMNEFLTFSRPRQLEFARCEVTELLDQVLDLSEQAFEEKDLTLHREYDSQSIELYLDAEHMERVFTNLVFNAVDAMEEGDAFYLRARTLPTEQWLTEHEGTELQGPFTPEMLCLEFEDTGAGMPPDVMAHIFEPFYTTKSAGTGLGLAITQRIVEEHGGHIEVESQEGQGTTFTVSLPRRI
jgi:PAS domain S-box-containing protein